MVEQKLSIALLPNQYISNNNSKLIVEISNQHIVLLEKNNNTSQSFEYYEISGTNGDWDSIFASAKNQSKILSNFYSNTTVYLNSLENLIVPSEKFQRNSVDAFLTTVYGDTNNTQTETDLINIADNPVAVYRCSNELNTAIKKYFVSFNYKSIYTKTLENLFHNDRMLMEMVKVQLYESTMLVVVICNNKLMLIQTYNYTSPEDIIYYLLNIVQEFNLSVKSTPVEVSGFIDKNSRQFELLENIFGRLSLETISNDGLFNTSVEPSKAHFYTPFYNL